MIQYNIVHKFYRSKRDMESGEPFKVHAHAFAPMPLREALTVRRKLCPPDNAIDAIVAVIEPIT